MKGIKIQSAVCVALLLGSGALLQAQNPRVGNTPVLIQDGFGPNGVDLPNDGLEYCCPTATTMGLYWLGSNGYAALAPASYDANNPSDVDAAHNLDLVIAGLIGTSPGGGTHTGAVPGLQVYFGLKGYSTTATVVETGKPTPGDIAAAVSGTGQDGFNTTVLSVGWYDDQTWDKNGGHCLALLDFIPGTGSSLGNVSINNPMQGPQTPEIYAMTDYPTAPADLQDSFYLQPSVLTPVATTVPVLQGMFTFNPGRDASDATVDAYDFSSEGQIIVDTNGGILTAPAQLAGSGSLVKNGAGALILETDAAGGNTFSGGLTVNQGFLVATQNSGAPVGTGDINLNGGSVLFNPVGSGGDLVLNASGVGSVINYVGGTIGLDRGSYDSLTVILGGVPGGITDNLLGAPQSSLILAAAGGLSSLGSTEKILVSGGSDIAMVLGSIVGQDNDTDLSGDFLKYTSSSGFQSFDNYVSSSVTALGAGTNQGTVYENVSNQSIAPNTSASVYAIKVTNSTVSGGSNSTLTVGQTNGGGVAGIILNGGQITASKLSFSNNTGVIYVNKAGGSISSSIEGSSGLVLHGPGTLRLSGNNSYTGNTLINSGTLVSLSASATGVGDVTVGAEGTLAGTGTVQGNLNLSGTIAPGDPEASSTIGTLTVNGNAVFQDGSAYIWELGSLTDSGTPGTDWDFLQVNGDIDLPSFADNLFAQVTLDFSDVDDPSSGNSFWATGREWEIASFTGSISNFAPQATSLDISNPRWGDDGRFKLQLDGQNIMLVYSVPEPSTWVLVMMGSLVLCFVYRSRRAKLQPRSRTVPR